MRLIHIQDYKYEKITKKKEEKTKKNYNKRKK